MIEYSKQFMLQHIKVIIIIMVSNYNSNVTTIPLSVCYGALNLLVRVDASNFVLYACDRAVTGAEYKGPESTAPSSAISVGSMAAERLYRTPGTLAPVFPVLGLAYVLGPYARSISFLPH